MFAMFNCVETVAASAEEAKEQERSVDERRSRGPISTKKKARRGRRRKRKQKVKGETLESSTKASSLYTPYSVGALMTVDEISR